MLDCPRLALLCALPWLLRAAVPGHGAEPLKRSAELPRNPRDPARGADFDRVYSGVVSLSTENIYSFNHTSHPGQVRSSLPRLTPTFEIAEPPPRYLQVLGRLQGTRKPSLYLSPLRQSLPCPSLGSSFGHRSASPRAHPGLVAAIPGLCRGAGTRILCGSWLRLGLSPGSLDGYVHGRKEEGGGG